MDEKERLKATIDQLQVAYGVLFGLSLLAIAANWFVFQHSAFGTGLWLLTLGSAVATRIYRSTLVNQYNSEINGGNGPLV
jgi:hypothetical protein